VLQFTELWTARQTAHRNLRAREIMAIVSTHQNQTTKILNGKSEEKRQIERPRGRWEKYY
jgi:hypothetical protein